MSRDLPEESEKRIEAVAHLMDNAIRIPGTHFRIGIDGIIGLIPGFGDFVGTIMGAYIIFEAARGGIPKTVVTKMIVNTLLDYFVGLIPFFGDLFDFAWKSNLRNLELYRAARAHPRRMKRRSSVELILWGVLLVVLFGFCIWGLWVALMWAGSIIQGRMS